MNSVRRALDTPENDALESRDFYEVCQQYRHSVEPSVVEAFENLKNFIRENAIVSTPPDLKAGDWLDCPDCGRPTNADLRAWCGQDPCPLRGK